MKIFFSILMLTSFAHAQVSQGEIKNFNFSYQAPLGDGVADSFSYQQKLDDAQKVHVEKMGDDFKINLEGVENQEIMFKNAPDLVKNAQSINLASFNLSLMDRALLSMSSGEFHSSDNDINLKNFNLACDRVPTFKDVLDQVLSGCVQKLNLKVGGFSSLGGDGLEQALMKAIDQQHDSFKGSVGIKNLDLKIAAGKFQLSADLKAQISGTATGSGTLKYEPEIKKVTVKVSEIKFGFLDLTSQVFDELKKQESSSMKVSKPYIYLTIK